MSRPSNSSFLWAAMCEHIDGLTGSVPSSMNVAEEFSAMDLARNMHEQLSALGIEITEDQAIKIMGSYARSVGGKLNPDDGGAFITYAGGGIFRRMQELAHPS